MTYLDSYNDTLQEVLVNGMRIYKGINNSFFVKKNELLKEEIVEFSIFLSIIELYPNLGRLTNVTSYSDIKEKLKLSFNKKDISHPEINDIYINDFCPILKENTKYFNEDIPDCYLTAELLLFNVSNKMNFVSEIYEKYYDPKQEKLASYSSNFKVLRDKLMISPPITLREITNAITNTAKEKEKPRTSKVYEKVVYFNPHLANTKEST